MEKLPVLGQQVFVLSPQGDVVRTMVAQLRQTKYLVGGQWVPRIDCTLLNGASAVRSWVSFNDALTAAIDHIEKRKAALRKELRELGKRSRHLQSDEYAKSVGAAPYKMVDLSGSEDRFRPRTRKNVTVPASYTLPSTIVYVIITPLTEPRGREDSLYRPHPHYVLETEVRSVWFSPDGTVGYDYATPLRPSEHFDTQEEATKALRSYSEPGTLEDVPFVSMEEEEAENDKIEDIPF